jgi:hypothetical protein
MGQDAENGGFSVVRFAAGSGSANGVLKAPSADLIHPGTLRYLREIGLAK